jgi:2-oxoglutarate ferredoxin oxidoreductase subunit delta
MGKIDINRDYCKGCGLCVVSCPLKLLRIGTEFNTSGYYAVEFSDSQESCTGCACCAEMCPDVAIEVWR